MATYTMRRSGLIVPRAVGYEGASYGRRLQAWITPDAGPNQAAKWSLRTLYDRCRDMVRNDPWASNAFRTFAAETVGEGVNPFWLLENKDLQHQISQLWTYWSEECDADENLPQGGMQALMAKTNWVSGSLLLRRRPRRATLDYAVPMQVQAMEPDYLRGDLQISQRSGNRVVLGVEVNRQGRRVGFHMHTEHPREAPTTPRTLFVPARDMVHMFIVDRPGQLIGVPVMAAGMVRLRQLAEYEDAELDRKKIAAMFALFIERPSGTTGDQPGGLSSTYGAPNPDGSTPESPTGPHNEEIRLEPGLVTELQPGEKIHASDPAQSDGQYPAYTREGKMGVAAAAMLPYEWLTGDTQGVNYTTIRASLLRFRRAARQWIKHTLVHKVVRTEVRWMLDTAVATGRLRLPGYSQPGGWRQYMPAGYQGDGWEWVDPQKEVAAATAAVAAGFISRSRVTLDRSGQTGEQVDMEQKADQDRADGLGLVFGWDARAKNSPPPDEEPDDETPDDEDEERDEDREESQVRNGDQ